LDRKTRSDETTLKNRRKSIFEDVTKIDLGEMWGEVLDWIHPAYDRDQCRALVDTVIKILVS
jgi:hypothetical protein